MKQSELHISLILIYISITLLNIKCEQQYNGYCTLEDKECSSETNSNKRYILYDVNPPEGFNLRRDVYIRYSVFAKLLSANTEKFGDVKLVLPPWSFLYHWETKQQRSYIPWGSYFDMKSLKSFAPVIEMYQYFQETKPSLTKIKIDEVYVLQHYTDMFETLSFVEKMSIEKCNDAIRTNFFHYHNMTSDSIKCLSFHGFASQLATIVEKSAAKSILFDHGEVALHDEFGGRVYWQCRRSMRFNAELKYVANNYRKNVLNSTDEEDDIHIPDDWMDEKPYRNARGGNYLSVHLRRRDFVRARPAEVPNLENAAEQITFEATRLRLNTVFVSTDAGPNEFNTIKEILFNRNLIAVKFEPTDAEVDKYTEGGIAIIDQIICAHARYFIGTFESTFSFRIQEEREILGFPTQATFNRLCGGKSRNCSSPSMWKIVY